MRGKLKNFHLPLQVHTGDPDMAEEWHEHYEVGRRAFKEGDYKGALKHLDAVVNEKNFSRRFQHARSYLLRRRQG